MEIAVDLMVIPRSASSARVSVYLISPDLPVEMIPALETRESVNVDLPWSTWAMTDMLRMLMGLSINSRICSMVKLTIFKQLQSGAFERRDRLKCTWVGQSIG
eukprot:NODE_508_length_6671_cov_0.774041.p5 type:complete len:103 gc:universal NODE_508_length_6671_cov_0.774041:2145-1837(-)